MVNIIIHKPKYPNIFVVEYKNRQRYTINDMRHGEKEILIFVISSIYVLRVVVQNEIIIEWGQENC